MSETNYEIPLAAGSCSKIQKSDVELLGELKMNGDVCSENYLPNNNICEDVVSSDCVENEQKLESESDGNTNECEDSSKEENDNWSVNRSEGSAVDESTTDSQNTEVQSSDPYNINDKTFEDEVYDSSEHNNGVLRKTSKKKKLSSGPGRGRPRKALVAMYHSQISGDKNAIKIRIKKSNFTAQVQVNMSKNKLILW